MKSTLLATVAVAALALGGTMASAQERGGSEMKASPAQSSGAPSSSAEKSAPGKAGAHSAQSEPNRGAEKSGHATGQQRAAEQRDSTGPNHDTGKARAEDRRPDMNKSSAAESDKTKHQAQQGQKEPNRTGAAEQTRDHSKAQAQDERAHKGKSTAASEHDRKSDQAQKATDSKDQMKSSAAKAGEDKNTAASEHNRKSDQAQGAASKEQMKSSAAKAEQDKSGAAADKSTASTQDKSGKASASNSSSSEDVNVTGSIQVDRQKATRVHDELIRNAPRANVNIDVNVGTRLPSHVHVRPVPTSIVSISPEFRGYDYVVVHDEIVIVEPKTKKVVTIIKSRGGSHKTHRASFTLDTRQKERIRKDVMIDKSREFNVDVREGRMVPQTVVLQPLPDVIYEDVPEMRDYRYFVDDRRIVIVDPDTREVVDIIE